MGSYKGIPTWSAIWRTTKDLEKKSVSNFNDKNQTNFRSLYQIIDYIYSDASILQEFKSRYSLFDIIKEDLDKVYNDLFEDPVIQLALFTDIIDDITKKPLGQVQVTGKQMNTDKVLFSFKDIQFTHFKEAIIKKAHTYFDHLAVQKYNKENNLKGKDAVGLEIIKGRKESTKPMASLISMDKGALLELIIIDTMAAIHGYGEGRVLKSRGVNAPYDYSIFDVPMEVKLGVNRFRYMEQAPSQVAKETLKAMREQAIMYYKQNQFDPEEYKNAFVRALVDYKTRASEGATFVTMSKNDVQYLLASDFIADLSSNNGEPILNERGTRLSMDDIYEILKLIKQQAAEDGLKPIHYKHVDTNVLWYGNRNGKVRSTVKQSHLHM